ncbi:hypothetical protein KEM54_001919, partial [Ascosphaera aggregata]
ILVLILTMITPRFLRAVRHSAVVAKTTISRIPPRRTTTTIATTTNATISSPSPPSPSQHHHHDLQSFLAYANRTSLSPSTTNYIGIHYEYTVCESLRKYGFNLTRIGGADDLGVDLVGTWDIVPSSSTASASSLSPSFSSAAASAQSETQTKLYERRSLRIIVQCKAHKRKTGPNLIRELEGTFAGAPPGWRGEGVFGVLVTTREVTKGVRDAMVRSRYPLIWMLAEQPTGKIKQCLWNHRATECGLSGLGVLVRHGGGAEVDGSVGFTWAGEEIQENGR